MTKRDLPTNIETPNLVGSDDADKSSGLGFVEKAFIYLLGLAFWLPVGGFLSIGPRMAHNIDSAVGRVALDGVAFLWIILPITGLFALNAPRSASIRVFGGNVLFWVCFLAYIHIKWHNAYPRS